MDRRQFLKYSGFFSVSVASGGLTACGGGTAASQASSGSDLPAASGGSWKFPQSVASGDPRPDSAVLWTRVVPSSVDVAAPAPSGNDVSIRLIVTAADNSALLGSNTALTGSTIVDTRLSVLAAYDNTVRNKVTGLTPGQTYFYQFIAGDVRSNVGRFKTAPAAGSNVSQVQFAYITCQDWSVNHWGAFSNIAQNENLDFIVHLGDYIYETVGASFQTAPVESSHISLQLPDGTVMKDINGNPTKAKYATTLADYRYLYKMYRSDPRQQAVHERFAYIAIWDDHEFSDDGWQDAITYDNNSLDAQGQNIHQPTRRRSANQAWFEFMPADVNFDSTSTGFQNIQIYRDFQFGNLMQLIMTDERLYRSDHVVPESIYNPATGKPLNNSIGSRYIVPQNVYNMLEAQEITTATAMTSDPLAYNTMLGQTQRDWWKGKMQNSSNTWKVWGNEVCLMRMGLNGTDAIATLIALNAISTVAGSITTALSNPALGGNVLVAAALVAAVTAGASQGTAAGAGVAIATADAQGGNTLAAAVAAGLSTTQAGIAVAAYNAAKSAAAAGTATQVGAAAQVIAFGYIKPDVQANQQNSQFVIASGQQAALSAFFTKFLLNCDQWDGYNAERKNLMAHLLNNKISNVVAVTGDIHGFFAGTVNSDFDAAGGGTPAMVDLVTAGISSDSFFSYMKAGAGSTGLATIVSYPLSIPVPNVGTVSINVNLLDYTMGKAAPTVDGLLEQIRVQLTGALAAQGVPEGAVLSGTVAAILASLKTNSAFNTNLLGLAQQLSALNSNPWLAHINADAQGYAVATVTPGSFVVQFKQVNKLVNTGSMTAPGNVVARVTTATVTSGKAAVSIS